MLTVGDVMTADVIKVHPETPVREIAQLLHGRRISGVPVVDKADNILGIVSEGDLIAHTDVIGDQEHRSSWLSIFASSRGSAVDYTRAHGRTARDVMTSPAITVSESASVAEVAKILERNRIKRVPVVRNGKLVGIVTRASLLQVLATKDVSKTSTLDDRAIRERIEAELKAQPWAHLSTKNVVVDNGVVHLFGMVESEEERRAVRLAAEQIPGVRAVEDHLGDMRIFKAEITRE